jgi:hypothetical protein
VSAADFPVGLRKIVANVVSFSLSWRAQTSLAVETRMKAVASLFALPQPAADIPTANGSTAGERADIKVSYKSGDIPIQLLRGISYQNSGLSHDPSASKQSSD